MPQVVKHQHLNPCLLHHALKGGLIGPIGCPVPVAEHRACRGEHVHSNQTQGRGQHRIHGDTATRAILGIRSSHRDKVPREVYLFPGRGEQFTGPKSGMQRRDFCLSGCSRGGCPCRAIQFSSSITGTSGIVGGICGGGLARSRGVQCQSMRRRARGHWARLGHGWQSLMENCICTTAFFRFSTVGV
jgi:hypothetical protein